MEERSISLLTNCKLTLCDKISADDKKLITFLTGSLQFKIAGVDPLVIEKDCPSTDDINRLLEALKASLHSHNREGIEHLRNSFELEQREENVTCDSFMQTLDENRQFTKHKLENNCGDDCSYKVSSQVEINNDAEYELVSIFKGLNVSDGNDSVHETNQMENNLENCENSTCQELTNEQLENEILEPLENATGAEKQETNSQHRGEGKKQVEKTQEEYFRKQDSAAECGSSNMQIIQDNFTPAGNEIKYSNNEQKQDSDYMKHSSKYERKLSTDIQDMDVTQTKPIAAQISSSRQTAEVSRENYQLIKEEKDKNHDIISVKKSCIKTVKHKQCDEDAESVNKNIIMTESLNASSQESLSNQDNVTKYSSPEAHTMKDALKEGGRQSKTEDMKTDQKNSKDAQINKEMTVQIQEAHKDNNSKDNSMISGAFACRQTTDTGKKDLNCTVFAGDNRLNQFYQPAASSRDVDKQLLANDESENLKVISTKLAKGQRAETSESQEYSPLSVPNVHQSPVNDIPNQENTNKQQKFTNEQISPSKRSRSKSNILKQRELDASKHFSRDDDSPGSDVESQNEITYSLKASSLDGVKIYFKGQLYEKYFHDAKNEGTCFIFRLNSCDEKDISFLNKLKHLKVEECDFGHKYKKHLESAVKEIQAQIDGIDIRVNDSKVHIVGLKDSVFSAKKKLSLLLQNYDSRTSQRQDMVKNLESTAKQGESSEKNSSNSLRNRDSSRNEISSDEETWSQKSEYEMGQKDSQSCKLADDAYSHSSLLSVKTTYSRDSEHNIFSKDHNNYYVRNERSNLKVKICKADITKLEVDCIVNAANKKLQHFGGVAKAISSAAGPALKQECEAFKLSGNQVAVTDIFISTGGKMPAKYVMHAVGPKWEAYDDNNKGQCIEDLRRTVIRCLVEAGRQGFTSVALPSISAAIFKVPKEVCAKCYMEAVKHFSTFNKEQTSLHEIFFVDVDEGMVKVIKEHFEKNWTNPCDPRSVQRDCDFANTHLYSTARNAAKYSEKPWNTNKPMPSSSVSAKTPGASKASSVPENRLPSGSTSSSTSDLKRESPIYQIGKFTLHTDSKPAFDHSSEITITVGKPFDKLSGIYDFSVSSNKKKMKVLKNKFKLFNVFKPKSQQQKLLCALLPEPDNTDKIEEAIGNLDTIMQSPNHKIFAQNIRKVVLTSSILYKEPDNNKKNQHSYDRKKVGDFARCLFEYLNRASEISNISITLVGSEDALQSVHKVMESRKAKTISQEIQQGARSKNRESPQYYNQGGISGQHSGQAGQGTDYTRQQHEDVQRRARGKASEGSQHYHQGDYSEHSGHAGQGRDYRRQHPEEDAGSSVDLEKTCEICYLGTSIYPVRCCGKLMCQDCEQRTPNCPFCRQFWRVFIGNQPPGTMKVRLINDYAEGYEHTRVWEIVYTFLSGVQMACHPNPGASYAGISRRAFLPANEDGLFVLKLLRLAFLRKLTFTIGRSLTMDKENSIVWNDIHHKTSLHGGPYGYPDPNYLLNVTQELASKGVTFDSVLAEERYNVNVFELSIGNIGFFIDAYPSWWW